MLREQVDTLPNSGNWIAADVFGDKSTNAIDGVSLKVYQNTSGNSITYETSGIIFSNVDGTMFLEASGFDPATKGFVVHRPYVESVIGEAINGTPSSGSMFLNTYGKPVAIDNAWPNLVPSLEDIEFGAAAGFDFSDDFAGPRFNTASGSQLIRPSGMILSILGADRADVYNNMNLYTSAWNHTQVGSGVDNDPFYLTISGAGLPSSTLNLCMSGQIPNQEQLDLRVRGK